MEVSDEVTLEWRPERRDIAGHVDRQVISFPRHGNSTHQSLRVGICLLYSKRTRRPVWLGWSEQEGSGKR